MTNTDEPTPDEGSAGAERPADEQTQQPQAEAEAPADPEPSGFDAEAYQDLSALSVDQLRELLLRATERDQFLERMQRMQAETENLKKRLNRQQAERLRQANEGLIRDLLPALDGLGLAITNAGTPEPGSPLAAFLEGVEQTRRQFLSALANHGVQPIATDGTFDPAVHEALLTQSDPEQPDQAVLAVLQPGFTLHGKVLRAAQVTVNRQG